MNDTLRAIERCERGRCTSRQLQFAQIVVFNDPRSFFGRPLEKAQTPG